MDNITFKRSGWAIPSLVLLLSLVPWLNVYASDLASELEHLIGYTVLASKTIEGWYDDNEVKKGSFEGCRHGRVIVFTDRTKLTCAEYGYMYSYRPTAIILGKRIEFGGRSFTDFKMVVEDEVYDMNR